MLPYIAKEVALVRSAARGSLSEEPKETQGPIKTLTRKPGCNFLTAAQDYRVFYDLRIHD
jgi:hypothetical protein